VRADVHVKTLATVGTRTSSNFVGVIEQDRGHTHAPKLNSSGEPAQAAAHDDHPILGASHIST